MLKSSLFILLGINIFVSDLKILVMTTCILVLINLLNHVEIIKNIKKIKVLFIMYFITCMLQIFYTQEGHVLYKIGKYYITEEGILNFTINFLRILNLLLISWVIVKRKLLSSRFNKYERVIETTIELVPVALVMIRKKMKIKWFFRYILKQIKVKN